MELTAAPFPGAVILAGITGTRTAAGTGSCSGSGSCTEEAVDVTVGVARVAAAAGGTGGAAAGRPREGWAEKSALSLTLAVAVAQTLSSGLDVQW